MGYAMSELQFSVQKEERNRNSSLMNFADLFKRYDGNDLGVQTFVSHWAFDNTFSSKIEMNEQKNHHS